jgi:UDP-N-acetylmuramoyl-tripeptide--D-alanyl-D-alanine ligase
LKLTAAEVISLVGGGLVSGSGKTRIGSVSIDSRTVERGDLFFAIVGQRLDGHRFIGQALERGAVGAVVSMPPTDVTESGAAVMIRVEDTTVALQELAKAVRRSAGIKVVAVTGSVGKTTAKEATAAALGARFRVLKSEGNLNNLYGLPLSILKLDGEEVAVLEMGMSAPGEIARLTEIARPDVGVVLNVAEVHREFFPSLEAIARAKGELFAGLEAGAVAVVNADDPLALAEARRFSGRQIRFGVREKAELRAKELTRTPEGVRFIAEAESDRAEVRAPLHGVHNVYNLLAALAVSGALGLSLAAAAEKLRGLRPSPHRGERIQFRAGPLVIDETYNSNPAGLAAALACLAEEEASRRIAVLGDMLELGDRAEALHLECGRQAAESGLSLLIGVGSLGALLVEGARRAGMAETALLTAGDAAEAGELLARRATRGDAVLLKASRGVALEGALSAIRKRYAVGSA